MLLLDSFFFPDCNTETENVPLLLIGIISEVSNNVGLYQSEEEHVSSDLSGDTFTVSVHFLILNT